MPMKSSCLRFFAASICLPSASQRRTLRTQASLLLAMACTALLLMPVSGSAQARSPAQNPWVGDAVSPEPALATGLSPKLKRKDVAAALRKVADWQLQKSSPGFNQDWTFAALYAGYMAVPEAVAGKKYQLAMLEVGKKYQWQLGPRPAHADDHAIGQSYIDLARLYPGQADAGPTRARMDAVMQLPDDPAKPLWWWCDALFMGPAVLAKLSRDTGERKYLDFMDREWWITSGLLYNPKDHLYFRDKSFFAAHQANGANVYWARGNGWVFAGLARVLSEMPADYPTRPRYVAQFREMAQAIAALQGADGLWRAGLLDQAEYTLPENSGSAFFTYGFAWGINAGLLDGKQYKPVVEKGWRGLLAHVYADGRLGCIQPVGAAPGAFTPTSNYVYGTGAFLLAGSEVYRLAK